MKNHFKVVAVILLTIVAVIVVLVATGIYTFNDSQDDTSPSIEGDGADTT